MFEKISFKMGDVEKQIMAVDSSLWPWLKVPHEMHLDCIYHCIHVGVYYWRFFHNSKKETVQPNCMLALREEKFYNHFSQCFKITQKDSSFHITVTMQTTLYHHRVEFSRQKIYIRIYSFGAKIETFRVNLASKFKGDFQGDFKPFCRNEEWNVS